MGSITENSFKEKKKIILHIHKRMASYEKEGEQSTYSSRKNKICFLKPSGEPYNH